MKTWCSQKDLCKNIHSSFIHHRQKLETLQRRTDNANCITSEQQKTTLYRKEQTTNKGNKVDGLCMSSWWLFCLCDILEQAKLNLFKKKKKKELWLSGKEHERPYSRIIKIFVLYLDRGLGSMDGSIYQNSSNDTLEIWAFHCFINFYHQKYTYNKCMNKYWTLINAYVCWSVYEWSILMSATYYKMHSQNNIGW